MENLTFKSEHLIGFTDSQYWLEKTHHLFQIQSKILINITICISGKTQNVSIWLNFEKLYSE